MQTKALLIGLSAFLSASVGIADDHYPSWPCRALGASAWLTSNSTEGEYAIRIEDPERMRRAFGGGLVANGMLLPIPMVNVAERLADDARAVSFYVQEEPVNLGTTKRPIPLDGTWSGRDPLSCLRAFCTAGGLEVRVLDGGVWLIGPTADLDASAVVVVAYPFDFERNGSLDLDEERALLRDLPVRLFNPTKEHDFEPDLYWLSLGYYRLPGEPGALVVLATKGSATTGHEVPAEVFKVKLDDTPSGPAVTCIWQSAAHGELMPQFVEDVDGDGVTDILLGGVGAVNAWDVLLSGVDGKQLAEFSTEVLAVEQRTEGPRRLAVKYLRRGGDHPIARLLAYNAEKRAFEPATTRLDEEALKLRAEKGQTSSDEGHEASPRRAQGPGAGEGLWDARHENRG